MIVENVQLRLENGLETRPAARLVQEASKYQSKIYIENNGRRVNAKSIMGVMSICLVGGENLVLSVSGLDEQEAANNMRKFLSGQCA